MTRFDLSRSQIPPNNIVPIVHKDMSLGVNTRQHGTLLAENQAEELYNIDLHTPGKRPMRKGSTLIGNDVGNSSFVCLLDTDLKLLGFEGVNARFWDGSGNWGTPFYTSISGTDVGAVYCKESGLTPDNIVIFQDGVNNAQRTLLDGTLQDLGDTNTSPPKTTVMCWYGNRVWCLYDDQLHFSDAYPADYSAAFDRTTNWFRIQVGEERALIPTRELGMIVCGKNSIWSFIPSAVPSATDYAAPYLYDYGLVSKKGWCMAGDEVYFFSHDGLRGLKRTVQDKLQLGLSYPISYPLKTEFDLINWARIEELSMVYFDNKIICSVPTSTADYMTWVYYPSTGGITVWGGWHARCFAVYKVDNEPRLFYGKLGDGTTYRALYGYTDEGTSTTNGTAITMREVSRKEDFGNSLVKKEGHTFGLSFERNEEVDVDIYCQLDDSGWEFLGTLTVQDSGLIDMSDPYLDGSTPYSIDFTGGATVDFSEVAVQKQNYHIRTYRKFNYIQFKYEITDAVSHDIVLLETSATAILDPFMEE